MTAKQNIVQDRGPSNINLGIFVCSFGVCRPSSPVPFINYAQERSGIHASIVKSALSTYLASKMNELT